MLTQPASPPNRLNTLHPKTVSAVLVGYPNTGKSTLFNQLTHAKQAIGNRAGVTVSQQQGWFNCHDKHIHLTDLPGCYTLQTPLSPDEVIAQQYLKNQTVDWVIQVIDVMQLQRQLLLTLALKTQYPHLIVVLNRVDLLESESRGVDCTALSNALGCPVIPMSAKKQQGLSALQRCLAGPPFSQPDTLPTLPNTLEKKTAWIKKQVDCTLLPITAVPGHRPITRHTDITEQIDRWVLHPYLGLPLFIGALYLMLSLCMYMGGHMQDWVSDWAEQWLIVDLNRTLHAWGLPPWINAICTHGIGRGLQTILAFFPVLGLLFFCMGWLEESGYLSRVVFITDRLMRTLRLPGQAFIPLIIGFGCNVPAVLSTRTLHNPQARIITVLMTPFMSCSARLAIYAIFITAFFPHYAGSLMLLLYLTGILVAILTGYLFSTLLKVDTAFPLVMEMPLYQNPPLLPLIKHSIQKMRHFLFRSGRLILPVCVIIGTLNALHMETRILHHHTIHTASHATSTTAASPSLLAHVGRTLTPLLRPLGIQPDNWPATVGLLTGVLAKEVVIGTLNTLYSQTSQHAFSPTLLAHAFHTNISAIAYLLFILLYMPCISTLAVITRELNRHWATVSFLWSTGIAYATSTLFYQLGSVFCLPHPDIRSVLLTVFLTLTATPLFALGLCHYVKRQDNTNFNANRTQAAGCSPQPCKGCTLYANGGCGSAKRA